MKKDLSEKTAIFLFSLTIIILIIIACLRIINKEDSNNIILSQAENICDSVLAMNEKDRKDGLSLEEYSNYTSIMILNNETFNYVAKFNEKTNKLIYLCITNGKERIELSAENIDKNFIKKFGKAELSSKECKL